MTASAGRLIAVDGVTGLGARARALAAMHRDERPCVSLWDASAIFSEVQLATVGAGDPSARTIFLLYAADLAYRVRAEITPALDAGRLVIAAPYVDTAVALGQAIGLHAGWVATTLSFAPAVETRELVKDPPAEERADRKGFVEFCSRQLFDAGNPAARLDLIKRTMARLEASQEARA